MADGSHAFNFPRPQVSRLRPGEIVIDLFAGGGGASEALKQAIGVDPALAYNHDEWAIGMHAANHPLTQHHREDIWHADPRIDVAGRKVGWFHASPDCTHFSQAIGGQPRSGKIRALSWVVLKWVGQLAKVGLAPRIISLENVWQITKWGPLIAKRDRATGRVLTMEKVVDPASGRKVYRVANPGERVSVQNQQLVPDPRYLGRTWRQFIAALRSYGYEVEWRKLDASEFGARTDRERLFLIARRDGLPIRWPAPTQGDEGSTAAAGAIDWSVLGTSIFTRKRPLRPNTIRRLLDGAVRGRWPQPYIDALKALRDGQEPRLDIAIEEAEEIAQRMGHRAGMVMATGGGGAARQVSEPVPTITTGGAANDHRPGCARPQLFEPIIAPYYGSGSGTTGQSCGEPVIVGYRIDILYRMLFERELFCAQGFPPDYIIHRTADGRRITRTQAIRMVGNSVSPPPLRALAEANLDPVAELRIAA